MLAAAASVVVLACSDSPPPPPRAPETSAAPVAADPAAPPEVTVAVEELTAPYFTDGDAAAGLERFAAEQYGQARQLFSAHVPGSEADAARLRLLVALCDARMRRWSEAAEGFRAAAPHTVLADYAYYQAARAALAGGDVDGAVASARQVAAASEYGEAAHLLIGDALHEQRKWAKLVEHDERYLAAWPGSARASEVRYRLAHAYERTDRRVPEASDHYRYLTVVEPRSIHGRRAAKRLKALLRRLPRREARRHRALAARDHIALGMALYDARRHTKAAREFARALEAKATTPQDTCVAAYYLADSWFRHRDRTKSAPLFDAAFQRCAEAGDVDYQVKAAYQAGKSLAILGDWDGARDRFARAEEVGAAHGHSFADDARVLQAEAAAMLGDRDGARALLAELPARYAAGDMRAEAQWRLAWMAYRDGDDAAALAWLGKQLAEPPGDPDRQAHARARYWIARVHARAGAAREAVAAYAATARDYPLTYYSLLALNRLREASPDDYRTVMAELATPPPAVAPVALRPRLIEQDPGGQRVVELYRLGLRAQAEAELLRRGRGRPADDTGHAEIMWLAALLHHGAGNHAGAVWVTRWYATDYKRAWPVGDNRVKWDIAYPRAYGEPIDALAATYGYPAALQLAIVREESGFNPRIESRANAIGLSQLIVPTARRFGGEIGIRASARNLRDPDKNLAIGARFLGFLWTKWTGRVGLIPPSYNAGEAAVARWIAERGELPLDEWIEAIPGDQARGYTKRVLASYFVYAYLADGTVPALPNAPVGVTD